MSVSQSTAQTQYFPDCKFEDERFVERWSVHKERLITLVGVRYFSVK